MESKFVRISNNVFTANILFSLANTFNLRNTSTHQYELPGKDVDEIASVWNDVGEELQVALDEYRRKYEQGQYKISTK